MHDKKFFDLMERALNEWKGTPEELGETLEVATETIEPPPQKGSPLYDSCIAWREEIHTARKRLRDAGANCVALYDAERKRKLMR